MKWIPGVILAALALYAATGRPLPLLGSGKDVFWVLLVLGMAACTPGVGAAIANGGFTSPLFVVGAIFGVAALALAAAVATGMRPAFIANDAQLIVAIAAIIAVKVVIATAHGMLVATR